MTLKGYVRIWLFVTLLLAYESYALNESQDSSLIKLAMDLGYLPKGIDLSPLPGKYISLWYGWLGIGFMLMTNPYIFRKRFSIFKKMGRLAGWLDFHILCGLLGPTFILFHTNFKIGGLVAVSFWSMMVSFSSGVVGRYFYMQLVGTKSEFEKIMNAWDATIKSFSNQVNAVATEQSRSSVLSIAGVGSGADDHASVFSSVMNSMWGDFRLSFGLGGAAAKLPPKMQEALKGYAVTRRRIIYLEQFRKVMGYWHTFHMPFAVFMYIVAAIHIATALLLQVRV